MSTEEIDLDRAIGGDRPVELIQHKERRKKPRVGDLFAIQIKGGGWIAGRVIHKNPSQLPGEVRGPFLDSYLVYFYKYIYAECPNDTILPMSPCLIVPPMIIDRQLWTYGYVVPICHSSLLETELLPNHCFYSVARQVFHDEYGKTLEKMTRPCGLSDLFLLDGVGGWLGRSLHDGFDQDSHPLS